MLRALLAWVLVAGLGGCASLQPMPSGEPGAGGFELSGRVAVRYGGESATGRVQWRHTESADDLLITNPLGQGVARITRSGGDFELETSDGRQYRAPDAESLTTQVLGWTLPLRGLPEWVRGRARPDNPAQVVRDSEQRVAEIRQDDWRIGYDTYSGSRPERLTLSRADVEIRLLIETWQASSP